MAELLVFHHAQGLTPGLRAFAERMTAAGHTAHVGFSLGVLPAQALAQTRAGARAAVLFHSCVPPSAFGAWRAGVPLQIHIMDRDRLASPPEIDLETARRLDSELDEATFFHYPGEAHLFADESLPSYDAEAARLAEQRVLELLG